MSSPANQIPANGFFLSAISILETELGTLLGARKDAAQGEALRARIDDQDPFASRPASWPSIRRWRGVALAFMFWGPRAERDALIAATALVHGLTVVTRNVADFQPTGVALLNPWRAQRSGDA